MSDEQRPNTGLNIEDDMDRYLTNKASAFRYPPTPDIATSVRNRLVEGAYKKSGRSSSSPHRPRSAWAAMALTAVVIVGALLAVPGVRSFMGDVYSGIMEWMQPTERRDPEVPTVTPIDRWETELAGSIDLGNLDKSNTTDIEYPALLGEPDYVFYQPDNNSILVYVWLDPNDASKPRVALYQIRSVASMSIWGDSLSSETQLAWEHVSINTYLGGKWIPKSLNITLQYQDAAGKRELRSGYIVNGNTLIWSSLDDSYTYKLEGAFSRDEAIRIAASLRPPPSVPTPLPTPTAVSPVSNLDLVVRADLYDLEASTGFRVKIPVLPDLPELVQPDMVFLQGSAGRPSSGQVVILAWLVPGRPNDLRMLLTQGIGDTMSGVDSSKGAVTTSVNGNPATWVQAPQKVYVAGPDGQSPVLAERTYITGSHALIWQEGPLHYRLETTLPMSQAVKIAEALK